MSESTDAPVIIVERNRDVAQRLANAMMAADLPAPLYAQNGEEAIFHLSRTPADVVVVADGLDGISAQETIKGLRFIRPETGIILISGARSESAAVEAFRAGVRAYVPRTAGFERSVVHHISALFGRPLHPGYERALRLIGRQADRENLTALSLLEVGGGFLLRSRSEALEAVTLEFPFTMFDVLERRAIAARGERDRLRVIRPLTPTGNEDALRAIGGSLDWNHADAVTVNELGSFIALSGVAPSSGGGDLTLGPFQQLLYADDVVHAIEEARGRRA